MSKIQEIIESGMEYYDKNFIQTRSVEYMMIVYAEWYLEQFKKRCNDYLIADENGQTMITETEFNQIPNPPHE